MDFTTFLNLTSMQQPVKWCGFLGYNINIFEQFSKNDDIYIMGTLTSYFYVNDLPEKDMKLGEKYLQIIKI